jgi:glycosyltransferase involved in cell wall biosynthesis
LPSYIFHSEGPKLKLSIITVCYNDASALERTINSIKNQNFQLEHIVIDGGSTDGTVDLLKKYRLKCDNLAYLSEPDNGVYDAINKGVHIATSEYILVLNAGDTFFSNDAINQIFTSDYFTSQDYLIGRVSYVYKSGRSKNDNVDFPSLKNIECSHQAFIYKKSLHTELGYYSLDYNSASDYDFFSKINGRYGLLQLKKFPVVIAIREKFGGDMSDSVKHTVEMIKVDYYHRILRHTFHRRAKEIIVKLIKYVKDKI